MPGLFCLFAPVMTSAAGRAPLTSLGPCRRVLLAFIRQGGVTMKKYLGAEGGVCLEPSFGLSLTVTIA